MKKKSVLTNRKFLSKFRTYYLGSRAYFYDFRRFLKYSNSKNRISNEKKLKGLLTMKYHIVEKGLTMPEPRLGFGVDVLKTLIELCQVYISRKYNQSDLEFRHSISVLKEYIEFHEKRNHKIEPNIKEQILDLISKVGIKESEKQLVIDKATFLKYRTAAFDEFSCSRYTVRSYSSEDIPLDILHNCIKLANKAPSACNRQPNRVHVVKNKELISKILLSQNGNRGFGHLANTLLIFTSDISVFQTVFERNELYLNSGMFAMSMIHALHFNSIGSCALNWSVRKEQDIELRKILNIPNNETITLILSCGYLPQEFNIAASPRLDIQEITKEYL